MEFAFYKKTSLPRRQKRRFRSMIVAVEGPFGGGNVLRIVLLGLLALVVAAVAIVVVRIGPANVVGMLRYDQRREGTLRVGDPAPDADLLALDGRTPVRLAERLGGRPCVVVLGSFT
jgi:hypothetical protein